MVHSRTFFFLISTMAPWFSLAQEDLHFSQFYETSILRNPALTGVFESDCKISLFYRDQWSAITAPYRTAQLNVEGRVKLSKGGNDFLSFGLATGYDLAG